MSFVCILSMGIAMTVGPGQSQVTLLDLLDKYTSNQDRLNSWCIKCKEVSEYAIDSDDRQRSVYDYDMRFDGQRIRVCWGEWESPLSVERSAAASRVARKSLLWDGKWYINFGVWADGNEPGTAIVNHTPRDRDVELLRYAHPCASLLGYYDAASCARLDKMLRQAKTVSLRKERESVNGAPCWVIDATTEHGDYTVWLDPEHGYTAAKVYVRTIKTNKPPKRGQPPIRIETTREIMNTRFKEIDGVWVPIEEQQVYRITSSAGHAMREDKHIEVSEIVLNPDHETLGSFRTDYIPNGTRVSLYPILQISYTWQDGELVPNIDEAVVAATDKTLASMKDIAGEANEIGEDGGSDPVEPFVAVAKSATASPLGPRPHCGLYCLYSLLKLSGRETDYRSLVKPEYFGSREGSSLADLDRAATDHGLHSYIAARLTTRTLRACPCPALLHVRPAGEGREYNHYELFLGTVDGKAELFNPPEKPRLATFEELAARWDGAALFVSDQPVDIGPVLAVDRHRLLLYGMGGVVMLLALHAGRRRWLTSVGKMSRRWSIGLTLGQAVVLGIVALLCGTLYHVLNSEALLANAMATASLQKAYLGTFIPRIGHSEVRRVLGTDIVVIDARLARDYQAAHLDGAISLPVDANEALWKRTAETIPKGKPIMVYCQSDRCKFAERVSVRLTKDGFSGISIYRGGWSDWTAKKKGVGDSG